MQTIIEPIASTHATALSQWLDADPGSRKFIARSVPPCTTCNGMLERLIAAVDNGGFYAWVMRTDAGEIIAYAELKKTDKVSDNELELIYVVAAPWRNRGVGTELIDKLVSGELRGLCDVVVAFISPDNQASRQVLVKNQFVEMPGAFDGIRYVYLVKPELPETAAG